MPALAKEKKLDAVFHALSNRTRRALLESLASGPARVGELAGPHRMSLNAVSKHLFVLERAGLIHRTRDGHVQSCVFDPAPLESADAWLDRYRSFWNRKLDKLAAFVETRGR
jgi:DNA-binding transcriptional ArsR family regulator